MLFAGQLRNMEKLISEDFLKFKANDKVRSDRKCVYLSDTKLIKDVSTQLLNRRLVSFYIIIHFGCTYIYMM